MLPLISLENLKLSKMVCGTNQFVGITHRWNPLEIWYHKFKYRDEETVAEYMIFLNLNYGVNCCVSSPREKIYKAIKITEKETGNKFHWLCTPSERSTVPGLDSDIFSQIQWCADHEVSVCMPHRSYTDNAINFQSLRIGGENKYPALEDLLEIIRDDGMITGLSSHYIQVIEAVEQHNYDVPLIIQPLNKIGFESNTQPEQLAKKIQETSIQILNIKPMGAGRVPPKEGIEWSLSRIKQNDLIAVGFGNMDNCKEDAAIIDHFINQS